MSRPAYPLNMTRLRAELDGHTCTRRCGDHWHLSSMTASAAGRP